MIYFFGVATSGKKNQNNGIIYPNLPYGGRGQFQHDTLSYDS